MTLTSLQSLELELEPKHNDEWPVRASIVIKRRRAIVISGGENNVIMVNSLMEQLATMDITTQKQSKMSSYRTLLKKRAHSRRKNRVAIFDNKIMRTPGSDSSSCIQVEPLVLNLKQIEDLDTDMAAAP